MKIGIKIIFGIVMVIILTKSCNAFADGVTTTREATLSWGFPTTNVDGTILMDLSGFKIYHGSSSGVYSSSIDVGMGSPYTPCSSENCGTYIITNLTVGTTYYFVATAYDAAGNESTYSNEVLKTISAPITGIPAPTGIQITSVGGTVTLSWDKTDNLNVIGYQISRGPSANMFTATYDVGPGYADSTPCIVSYTGCARSQFIFNRIVPGTYFWRIMAYDASSVFGEASAIASITIVADAIIPADVANFSAAKYSTGTRLSWANPSDPDFYGLLLEYSFDNSAGPWTLLANLRGLPGGNQTHDHLNLPTGAYYYRIHTKDTSGNITSTEYADITLKNPPIDISSEPEIVKPEIPPVVITEPPKIDQTPPQTTIITTVQEIPLVVIEAVPPAKKEKGKKENNGFGCSTIKNTKPPDDGSADVSAVTIAATILFFIARRKMRSRIN